MGKMDELSRRLEAVERELEEMRERRGDAPPTPPPANYREDEEE